MHRLKAEHMLRRARLAALGESFVILTLLVWLSLEYQNNFYMQQWMTAHFWPAAWLLNGTLVGATAGWLVGRAGGVWEGGGAAGAGKFESLGEKVWFFSPPMAVF